MHLEILFRRLIRPARHAVACKETVKSRLIEAIKIYWYPLATKLPQEDSLSTREYYCSSRRQPQHTTQEKFARKGRSVIDDSPGLETGNVRHNGGQTPEQTEIDVVVGVSRA